jgi:hypothetical protein
VDLRNVTAWRWTAVLAVFTVALFGLLWVLGESNPAGTFSFPAAIIAVGVIGGLLARRTADLLGVVAGIIVVFEAIALREVADHGSSIATFTLMLGIALVPGGFAAGLGLIVLAVRRAIRGAGPRAVLLRGAAVSAVLATLAVGYVLAATRPARVDAFRLTGGQEIAVTVTSGTATWCRLTSVTEAAADLTIGAGCVSLILGPTTAVGIPMELPVRLSQPLADRLVRNVDGSVVPQMPPPDYPVDLDRAMELAQEVLRAAHPGIALENTKVMDHTLEKDPSGRPAWKVNIIVVDGPFASPSPTSIWMWVDAESGTVTEISRS